MEDAIRKGLIDFVFATTTLAEGVNFPFSTVVVQSLALHELPSIGVPRKYRPITPRSFWNIAGRAGRPGFDKEGQVILFEPSLGLEKIKAVLADYLNPELKNIAPVKSALSQSIAALYESLSVGQIKKEDLLNIELENSVPKTIRGTVNLLRVGLVHAKANNILSSPEEILEGSFAKNFLSPEQMKFGTEVLNDQAKLLTEFFQSTGAPSEKIVAEIGLSIDTMERLKNFVLKLSDWQIEKYSSLFYGSNLNTKQAKYLIGPVAKNISELEGEKLGGYLSELIIKWLTGLPLITIKNTLRSPYSKRLINTRLENLISVIYSRIQFLLPWGLFAVDSILFEEAIRRNISYNNDIRKVAYLVDAGVSSFDALTLVNLNFERVDATRLFKLFQTKVNLSNQLDIVTWLLNERIGNIELALKGRDRRRIDYDLAALLEEIRMNHKP